jgi:hypothetical protein
MNLQDHGDKADNSCPGLDALNSEGIHSLMLLLVVVELIRINGGKSFALFSNAACEKGRTGLLEGQRHVPTVRHRSIVWSPAYASKTLLLRMKVYSTAVQPFVLVSCKQYELDILHTLSSPGGSPIHLRWLMLSLTFSSKNYLSPSLNPRVKLYF